jgi:hypothetical protein
MGLVLNLHLRNPKEMKNYRCGIYGHFAKKCMAPHPTQENNVVQQAKLVQNEMLQLF